MGEVLFGRNGRMKLAILFLPNQGSKESFDRAAYSILSGEETLSIAGL